VGEKTGIRKWLPLVVMAAALFIIVLDTTILNVSIRAIIGDLHTNLKAVQWVITGYSLMLAAFTITGGRLGDTFGRKRMFLIGACVFALGSLSASVAHSAPMLMVSVSLVEGAGAAMMMPATASLLLSEYRGKDRAIAFGVWGALAGAAATIGPLVGGWLTTHYSWRWNYLINPFVVLLLLAGSRTIQESRERDPHRPDIFSIVLSAIGLSSTVYGIIESSTYGWVKAKMAYEIFGHHFGLHGVSISLYAITIGVLFIAGFVWRQRTLARRGRVPLVSPLLLKNRQFVSGVSVVAIAAMTQMGLVFVLPVLLQGMLGKDAFHAGLAMLPFSLAVLVAAPLAGVLAGKKNVPPRYLIQIGFVGVLAGALLLRSEVTVLATTRHLVPGMALFGLGFGLAFSQLANLTLSAVSVEEAGEASGVNNTFRQVGASLGQALIGALLIAALTSQLRSDVTASGVVLPAAKPQLTADITAAASSLGTNNGAGGVLPPQAAAEVTRIKNHAIVSGVRTGMFATIGAAVFALLLSTQLPKRSKRAEDVDASSQ